MQVNVELKGAASIDGLRSILEAWESQFPMGEALGISGYGQFILTLKMPQATQVIPPQLVDLSASTVD